jgi:energy-coupling factor transport system ATP-binding protein
VYFKYRNGVLALSDINLKINTGELVAIVGTNGSGKTTLIRHLNGLLKPSSGTISIFGVDTRTVQVSNLSKKVGIVFQNPDHQLFSNTVTDEIVFGLRNFGYTEELAKKRAEATMSFFGLTALKDRPPLTLSGGEKKRVCIAAVLAWEPDILVLDEPTVGQDFINKKKLYQAIVEYKEAGRTVILVTHDVEFIWPLQPRVLVMTKGRIACDGRASDVFTDEGVMQSASLTMPQLAELSTKLGISPPAVDIKQLLKMREDWLHI